MTTKTHTPPRKKRTERTEPQRGTKKMERMDKGMLL